MAIFHLLLLCSASPYTFDNHFRRRWTESSCKHQEYVHLIYYESSFVIFSAIGVREVSFVIAPSLSSFVVRQMCLTLLYHRISYLFSEGLILNNRLHRPINLNSFIFFQPQTVFPMPLLNTVKCSRSDLLCSSTTLPHLKSACWVFLETKKIGKTILKLRITWKFRSISYFKTRNRKS